jgi:MFS family permease
VSRSQSAPRPASRALQFVLIMGIVSLFADMTYEGGRGEVGAFLGHLGASGAIVGLVAGAGELAGYAIRSLSGAIADRTGRYWINAWVGYGLNLLCVPALALAGSWPAAAGLVIGERLGRGVRKPVVSAMIARAGGEMGGHGYAFGLHQALDQLGATVGPLIVAYAVARSGFHAGFGILIVPALLSLIVLAPALRAGRPLVPAASDSVEPSLTDPAAFRRYAIGGALVAAGYMDFALISFRFARDHVMSAAAISIWFAVAMAVAAVLAPLLGKLYDRFGNVVIAGAIVLTAAATPLAFLGRGAAAQTGVALWGAGTAVQDALLLALIGSVIARRRGATTFGLFDLIFGVAWFAGSAVSGVLLDRSMIGLVAFSVVLQLAAIPFFLRRRTAAAS